MPYRLKNAVMYSRELIVCATEICIDETRGTQNAVCRGVS
jgi:hypothetical protein